MLQRILLRDRRSLVLLSTVLLSTISNVVGLASAQAPEAADKQKSLAEPISRGQRVFSAGHSFHWATGQIVRELPRAAGIEDHVIAGEQPIGYSRVITQWNYP